MTDLNIMCVGFYWLFSIHKNTSLISNLSFACIALAILFIQLINLNYPPLLYINFAILFAYLTFLLWQKNKANFQIVVCIFAIPVLFTLLDMFSRQNLAFNTYSRNAWDAAYIAAGIWVIAKQDADWLSNYGAKLIYIALSIYTLLLIQFPISTIATLKPIHFLGINFSGATVTNTSHICILTAAVFLVALYFLVKSSWPLKVLTLPILVSLFLFILYTSWRPIWLGLIIGLTIAMLASYKNKRILILSSLALLQVVLLATNAGHYRDRMVNLATKSNTEERVFIWQDAWKMQLDSSSEKWITGHGLMSFLGDFKLYSRYYLHPTDLPVVKPIPRKLWVYNQAVNDYLIDFRIYSNYAKPKKASIYFNKAIGFRSPHNLLLDVLYTAGLFGLIIISCFYWFTMRHLVRLSQLSAKNRLLACLTLAALISNIIVNGLNFPFFLHFNLIPMAFICGVILYIHESHRQSLLIKP